MPFKFQSIILYCAYLFIYNKKRKKERVQILKFAIRFLRLPPPPPYKSVSVYNIMESEKIDHAMHDAQATEERNKGDGSSVSRLGGAPIYIQLVFQFMPEITSARRKMTAGSGWPAAAS